MILLLSYYSVYYVSKVTLWSLSQFTNLFRQKKEVDDEPIYVTREEIEELKREHEELKSKMKEIMI